MEVEHQVYKSLEQQVAVGHITSSEVKELLVAYARLAINMLFSGQTESVGKDRAASWLFRAQYENPGDQTAPTKEETDKSLHLLRLAEHARLIRSTDSEIQFSDSALLAYFCAYYLSSQPFTPQLLTAVTSQVPHLKVLRQVWLSWSQLDSSLVDKLATLLKQDPDLEVREAAAIALGSIADERCVEPLIGALDEKTIVSYWAVVGLGNTRDARAVRPLVDLLKNGGDEDLTKALGQLGEAAIEPVLDLLTDHNWITRSLAVETLGYIDNPRVVDPLIAALRDQDSMVRHIAAASLGRIGDKRAVEPLVEALKDESRDVRFAASWALGNIGNRRALEPLRHALQDEDNYVRQAASEALDKLS